MSRLTSEVSELDYVTTRYQGSKRRLVSWIFEQIQGLKYHSVLDAFSGTCAVGYEFKKRGKTVTCNDLLKSNYYTGLALVENSQVTLSDEEICYVLSRHENLRYPTFIQDTFGGIYYTDTENAWLDIAITNIHQMKNPYKRAIALYALFQSCLIKRPFNLFHRNNLYLRLAEVKRSFHNDKTWEKPFSEHFRRFAVEANTRVFSNGLENRAWNFDALSTPETNFDLTYVDSPYVSPTGKALDYYHLYHFLEGLSSYDHWSEEIDYTSKHLRLKPRPNAWGKKDTVEKAFDDLFKRFQDSILIVSYRSPGFPSRSTFKNLLEQYKKNVTIRMKRCNYVLSKMKSNFEVLLIAK